MPQSEIEDLKRLMAATAGGDRKAFRQLYEATSPKLYGIIVRICRDPGASQDVLQDTYVKVWSKAGGYDEREGRPFTWLAAVARNTAIDAIRRRREVALGKDDDGRAVIDSLIMDRSTVDPMETRALRNCLEALETPQGDCIALAYCDGYSREELAERYGAPVGTIKTWLRRGLAKLRTCLDGQ